MTEAAPADEGSLYVLGVRAEKFMGIELAELTFGDDGVTQFTGANGNGKTDALTAIEATLLGGSSLPTMAVHAGAERAETEVPIGGADGKPILFAKRVYRDGGKSSLEVRSADGVKLASPQAILDKLIDLRFFNPVSFANPGQRTEAANNEARREMLFEICPLRIDLAKHDAATKTLFDERTEVTKSVKKLTAVIEDAIAEASKSPVPAGPEEDEAALVGEIAKLENAGELRARAAKRRDELKKEVEDVETRVKRLREEIVQLETKADMLAQEWAKQGQLAMPGDAADPAPLKAKLAEARERNAKRRAASGQTALAEDRAKQLQAQRTRETELSAKLEQMEKERVDAIAAAKFPLPQLTINSEGWLAVRKKEGGVIPFHQESTARRILAGFIIMAAKRPRLRACIIPRGNDLDDAAMVTLAKYARQFGIRCYVERIVGSPEAGPVIEFSAGLVVKRGR